METPMEFSIPPVSSLTEIEAIERSDVAVQAWNAAIGGTVYGAIRASAQRHGDAPALTYIDSADGPARTVSYRELLDNITAAARFFSELAGPGCGVAYILPSFVETHYVLWGAEACGFAVPLNPSFSQTRSSILSVIRLPMCSCFRRARSLASRSVSRRSGRIFRMFVLWRSVRVLLRLCHRFQCGPGGQRRAWRRNVGAIGRQRLGCRVFPHRRDDRAAQACRAYQQESTCRRAGGCKPAWHAQG
jgi:hypothetical protein